jgi:hypothetical protein
VSSKAGESIVTNFQQQAEAAAANVSAIETEIRDLEDRKKKFAADAAVAREIATSALSAIGQAELDGESSRADTFRKARSENLKRTEELEAAISATEGRIHIVRAKLPDAKRDADKCSRRAGQAATLEVIQAIKPQLADVLTALASQPSLFSELADTFSFAARGSTDYPLQKLDEISARLRASLEDIIVPKQTFIPAGPPLLCDTAVFALAPFRFNNNGHEVTSIPSGWVGLVPAAAAERSAEKGVGQILARPAKMVVIIGRRDVETKSKDQLRVFRAGGEFTIETGLALHFAREGKLERFVGPSPTDMVAYQQATINRAKRAPEISLGTIRDEPLAAEDPAAAAPPPESELPEHEVSLKQAQRQARARTRATAAELGATLGSAGRRRSDNVQTSEG